MSDNSFNFEYQNLYNLLAARKWKQADKETTYLILKAVGKEKQGWMHIRDIQNLPIEHIREIDYIWSTLTNKKFGFNAQRKIYSDLGGTATFVHQSWSKLGRSTGWLFLWWHNPFQGYYYPQCRGNLPSHYLTKIKYKSKMSFEERIGLIGAWAIILILSLFSPLLVFIFQPIFYPARTILFKQKWLPWYTLIKHIRYRDTKTY